MRTDSISNHAAMVLALLDVSGIKNAWISKYLSHPVDVSDVFPAVLQKEPDFTISAFEYRRDAISESVSKYLRQNNCSLAVMGESGFPPVRGEVPAGERPVALFYRGNLNLLAARNNNVAVIGLLDPDAQTLSDEALIVAQLVERGHIIISGLAKGCDTQAHRTALEAGGQTVAILPSTLERILPEENATFAEEIIATGGLVITEYFRESQTPLEQTGRYVTRDRLQALFSDCVILAASYAKNDHGLDSGSRHAMAAAAKYGLMRGVLPDRSPLSNNPKYDLNREIRSVDPSALEFSPQMLRDLSIPNRAILPEQPAFLF